MKSKQIKESKAPAATKIASKLAKKYCKKPVKRVSLSRLDSELDKFYSRYIRLRDSDGEYGYCCTCGKYIHIAENDNGHYISRARKATKYDERNTHLQCKRCNIFLKGNIAAYAVFLEEKYGVGILQELLTKSDKITKLTVEWYKQKIAHYRNEVDKLDINKLWGKI